MASLDFIGFPPPLLGMDPQRLPVLGDDGIRLFLEKPRSTLVLPDNWYPRVPNIVEAIRYQASSGKPELQRGGVGEEGLFAVYNLEPEISGPALFSRERTDGEELRNALGSGQLTFTFELVCKANTMETELHCDLPIARHRESRRMLVSHKTGKITETKFQKVGDLGRFSLWQATSTYPRFHQVRIHAAEMGIPVLGDSLYGGPGMPLPSDCIPGYRPSLKREEKPIYPSAALRLSRVEGEGIPTVECPADKAWRAMLKRLGKKR